MFKAKSRLLQISVLVSNRHNGESIAGLIFSKLLFKIKRISSRLLTRYFPHHDFMKWRTRNENQATTGYLVSINAKSNEYLWSQVDLNRTLSILEVGSNVGNRMISKEILWPEIQFVGLEINKEACKVGNEYAQKNGILNLKFINGDISMNPLPDQLYGRKFDLVFSWATLIYVHPLRIKNAIKSILHLSSKEVIFVEQNSMELNSYPGYLGRLVKHEPTWMRNYSRILSIFSEIFVDSLTFESVPIDIWNPGGGGGTLIKYKLREVDDF